MNATSRAALTAILLVVLGSPARAQDETPGDVEGYAPLAVKDLKTASADRWTVDKKVYIDAKFSGIFGKKVKLETLEDLNRVEILADPDDELVRALAVPKTPRTDKGGQLLAKNKPLSNVRVFGITQLGADGQPLVSLERIVKLPDDEEEFKNALAELARKADVKPDDYFAVSRRAYARAELYKLDFSTLIRQANKEGMELKVRMRKRGDAKATIALAKEYHRFTSEVEAPIKLLGEVALDPASPDAERDEALALLKQHQAFLWRGEYVPYSRFKSSIGYLQRKGNWVRRERAELEDALERERNNATPIFRLLDYEKLIAAGKVERSMRKEEIIRTKGFGFPIYVDRVRFTDPKQQKNVSFEQWVFENGTRVYLWNGDCSEVVQKTTPWPEK